MKSRAELFTELTKFFRQDAAALITRKIINLNKKINPRDLKELNWKILFLKINMILIQQIKLKPDICLQHCL